MDWIDLLIQTGFVALGALIGSSVMWMTLGPWVARRGMRQFTEEAWDLTERESNDPKLMMKAIARKQADVVAQSMYGAFGNILQGVPDSELGALAQKAGIGLGGGMDGLSQLVDMMGNGGGGNNSFSGLVQMITALKMLAGDTGTRALPAQNPQYPQYPSP